MRTALLAFVLALGCALAAAAQSTLAPDRQLALAARQLAAIWRPVPQGAMTRASLAAACQGAVEEMAALDLRLPEPMTADALRDVRAELGLVFVPTDENPTLLFVFPNDELLRGVASGLGAFTLDPSGVGRVILRDAAGHDSNLELGQAGGHALLRIRPRGANDVQLYTACASTLG